MVVNVMEERVLSQASAFVCPPMPPTTPKNMTGVFNGLLSATKPQERAKTAVPPLSRPRGRRIFMKTSTPTEMKRYEKIQRVRDKECYQGFSSSPSTRVQLSKSASARSRANTPANPAVDEGARPQSPQLDGPIVKKISNQNSRQFTTVSNSGVQHKELLVDPNEGVAPLHRERQRPHTTHPRTSAEGVLPGGPPPVELIQYELDNSSPDSIVELRDCYRRICRGDPVQLRTLLANIRTTRGTGEMRYTGLIVRSYQKPKEIQIKFPPQRYRPVTAAAMGSAPGDLLLPQPCVTRNYRPVHIPTAATIANGYQLSYENSKYRRCPPMKASLEFSDEASRWITGRHAPSPVQHPNSNIDIPGKLDSSSVGSVGGKHVVGKSLNDKEGVTGVRLLSGWTGANAASPAEGETTHDQGKQDSTPKDTKENQLADGSLSGQGDKPPTEGEMTSTMAPAVKVVVVSLGEPADGEQATTTDSLRKPSVPPMVSVETDEGVVDAPLIDGHEDEAAETDYDGPAAAAKRQSIAERLEKFRLGEHAANTMKAEAEERRQRLASLFDEHENIVKQVNATEP